MSTKVKIKIGSVEVEFEGSEEFLKSELKKCIKTVMDTLEAVPSNLLAPPPSFHIPNEQEEQETINQWTTETIASKLNCKTGPDLIIAACAHLKFVAGKQSYTRPEIRDMMKSDTGHCRDTYLANLSSSLQRLVKSGKLNALAGKTYALTQKTLTELRQKLAIK